MNQTTDPTAPHAASAAPGRLERALNTPMSRGDHVALRILLVLTAVGAAIAVVAALWPSTTIQFIAQSADPGPRLPTTGTAANASANYSDQVVWTITDPTLAQRLLVALPTILGAAAVLGGVALLIGITASIRRDRAFTRTTATRVRWLALLVLLVGLLQPFVTAAVSFALVAQVQDQPSVLFTFNLTDFAPVLVGMLLLALGEVFSRGIVLADDVEGLV